MKRSINPYPALWFRKFFFCTLCIFFWFSICLSQEIVYTDSIHGIFAPSSTIGKIDIANCDSAFILSTSAIFKAYDIATLSDGRNYGYGKRFDDIDSLYLGVAPDGAFMVGPSLKVDERIRGMSCDENDFLYAAGKGITRQTLVFGNYQETYIGDLPPNMQCEGDITYRQGKFYLHSINNQLVEVNMKDPSKSKVLMDFPPGLLPIDGLATVQISCDSVITYAVGRAANNSKVYEIDFNDWTLTELCDLPLSITGTGSQTECMLPPCNIFLDLDSDNSSLAFRGDYCTDTFCVPPMSVADTDVVIISTLNPIEFITLELVGWLDAGQEYLSVSTANNINIIGNNTTLLTLENNGSASIADFEDAVSNVLFHNDAATVTYGVRKVLATAFAGGESSLVSIAELPLSNEQMLTMATVSEPSCHGFSNGSISVVSEGGAAPYAYEWENNQSGDFIDSLVVGVYPFQIIDALGCIKRDTVVLEEPDTLDVGLMYSGPPFLCDDSGQLVANAIGGTVQLSYLWSNGVLDSVNADISAGSYTVTVEDANGCIVIDSIDIPAGDTVLIIQNESLCQGGVIDWYGAAYSSDTLACHVFSTVNGCDSTICLSLTINPLPTVSIFQDGDLCDQNSVTLSTEEHEAYAWSTNETAPEIVVASAGNYDVTVTNIFGCESSASVTIFPPISFDVFVEDPSCPGIENGVIDIVNAPGGVVDQLYSIDGGDQFFPDGRFDGLAPGDYQVVVEGANGCREEVPISLDEPDPVTLDAGNDQSIILGESIVLSVTTNLVDPGVFWSPPDHLECPTCLTTIAQPLESIQYVVEVMDSDGCFVLDTVNILVGELLSNVYPPTAFSPNGDGINDYFTIHTDESVIEVVSLKVFDRWGGIVFDKSNFPPNDVGQGWDGLIRGKTASVGAYVFVAELLRVDGNVEILSGEVTLIR